MNSINIYHVVLRVSMTSYISAQNVTVIRQGQTILKDISLNVNNRDFITIIGPNGAGKSMLLKCLMGLYAPDTGTITRTPNLKIGYVPQHLFPDSTLPVSVRRFLSLRKKASIHAVTQIAEETGIGDVLHKPLHVLSGGQLQRTLLARALIDTPEVLILDEPAQNLDISGQLAFYKLLEKIYAERGVSILMVSHDLHMVMASSRQVVCLFHHICCSGEPHMITRDPEFISLFGNDMARMMAVYQHSHNHAHDHTHEHTGHHHD